MSEKRQWLLWQHTASNTLLKDISHLSHVLSLLCLPQPPSSKCWTCLAAFYSSLEKPFQALSLKMRPGTEHTRKTMGPETYTIHCTYHLSFTPVLFFRTFSILPFYHTELLLITRPPTMLLSVQFFVCTYKMGKVGHPEIQQTWHEWPNGRNWHHPWMAHMALLHLFRSPGFLKVLITDRHGFYYIWVPGQKSTKWFKS